MPFSRIPLQTGCTLMLLLSLLASPHTAIAADDVSESVLAESAAVEATLSGNTDTMETPDIAEAAIAEPAQISEPAEPSSVAASQTNNKPAADLKSQGPTLPTTNEKALEQYNRGVELFKIAQGQANKGNAQAQQRVLKESIKHFEKAVQVKPDFVEAQSNIGFAYLTLKKYSQAVTSFKTALKMQPKHLNSLNGLATTYAINNQADLALKTFDELTVLAPGQADYMFNQGAVLQKVGRFDDAEKAYMGALKVKPDHQRALFNLGTLKENQSHFEEALDYYQRAKGSEVGNTIGLEAMKRIEAIQQALVPGQSPPEPGKK